MLKCRTGVGPPIMAVGLLLLVGPTPTAAVTWMRVGSFSDASEVLQHGFQGVQEQPGESHKVRPGASANPKGLAEQLRDHTFKAYIAMSAFTVAVICVMYWSRGLGVIARILCYLLALSTMMLSVKFVFERYQYHYPKFITSCHFIFCSLVAGTILFRRSRQMATADPGGDAAPPKVVPTAKEFFHWILPIAVSFAVSAGANNMALVFCTATFAEIVGATAPVVSALLVVLVGLPFDLWLLCPTLLTVISCAVSMSGEVHFSTIGFLLCGLSLVSRSVRATMQQHLMTATTRDCLDPVTLLFWTCLPAFVLMQLWSTAVEGMGPYRDLLNADLRLVLGITASISLSCVNACILNLSNLFCTRDLGAVGIQLLAQLKSILVVLGSMALFGDTVTTRQLAGFGGVLVGIFWFSHAEGQVRRQKEVAKSPLAEGRMGLGTLWPLFPLFCARCCSLRRQPSGSTGSAAYGATSPGM